LFAISGEALTKRLRSKSFRAMLRQEVAYFEKAKHNTGALCTRLATEASDVQGASGVRFGMILQHLVAMVVGIIIGLIYSWQMGLLSMIFVPPVLFGGVTKIHLTKRYAKINKEILEDAGKVCEYFHFSSKLLNMNIICQDQTW
jgi:ABC-type multidrug transport system fused ATPase/permease subunit